MDLSTKALWRLETNGTRTIDSLISKKRKSVSVLAECKILDEYLKNERIAGVHRIRQRLNEKNENENENENEHEHEQESDNEINHKNENECDNENKNEYEGDEFEKEKEKEIEMNLDEVDMEEVKEVEEEVGMNFELSTPCKNIISLHKVDMRTQSTTRVDVDLNFINKENTIFKFQLDYNHNQDHNIKNFFDINDTQHLFPKHENEEDKKNMKEEEEMMSEEEEEVKREEETEEEEVKREEETETEEGESKREEREDQPEESVKNENMDLVPDEIQGLIPDFVDENNENFDISIDMTTYFSSGKSTKLPFLMIPSNQEEIIISSRVSFHSNTLHISHTSTNCSTPYSSVSPYILSPFQTIPSTPILDLSTPSSPSHSHYDHQQDRLYTFSEEKEFEKGHSNDNDIENSIPLISPHNNDFNLQISDYFEKSRQRKKKNENNHNINDDNNDDNNDINNNNNSNNDNNNSNNYNDGKGNVTNNRKTESIKKSQFMTNSSSIKSSDIRKFGALESNIVGEYKKGNYGYNIPPIVNGYTFKKIAENGNYLISRVFDFDKENSRKSEKEEEKDKEKAVLRKKSINKSETEKIKSKSNLKLSNTVGLGMRDILKRAETERANVGMLAEFTLSVIPEHVLKMTSKYCSSIIPFSNFLSYFLSSFWN